MKLIQKTTRYYITFIFLILGLGSVLFYMLIKIVLLDSIDDGLKQERDQIISNLNLEKEIELQSPANHVKIYPIQNLNKVKDHYKTVQELDSLGEIINYRELKSTFAFKYHNYQIEIRHSLEEANALLRGLFPMVLLLFLLLFLGIYIINNIIFKKLWEPFYYLLDTLRNYKINEHKVIQYKHTDIQEFNELSTSIESMTDQIYKDFVAQKEFNENSSHELQTPLAVIGNKLDLLIQSPNLKYQELNLVQDIYNSVKKLKGLNKGLILLNKIENRQYTNRETVNLQPIISNMLDDFSFQIEEMGLKVEFEYLNIKPIQTNTALMEILITNLISNAIKHNQKDGFIKIVLTKQKLTIENSSKNVIENPTIMFERFKKSSENSQSVGLGLAIVKKICSTMGYTINYEILNNNHQINVLFAN